MSGKFIDISEHNTILSYGAIAQSNLKGVIMKATEGTTYVDHAKDIYYDALNGKIALGFYHYLTSTSSPITQARNFWEQIKDKEYQITPVLDVEQDSLMNNAEWYSEQFIQEFFKLSGQNMIVYSGRCYIEEHFSDTFKRNHVWWVADYSATQVPTINNCNIIAWQFTEDYRSYAFAVGDLDCNELIDENNFYLGRVPSYQTYYSNDYASLQTELNNQGFRDKDGHKLVVDGMAGEFTLSACPIVKRGAEGNITKWIQAKLKIPADGIFGEQTRQAVINFQWINGIMTDGIVGQNTWKKLLGL